MLKFSEHICRYDKLDIVLSPTRRVSSFDFNNSKQKHALSQQKKERNIINTQKEAFAVVSFKS